MRLPERSGHSKHDLDLAVAGFFPSKCQKLAERCTELAEVMARLEEVGQSEPGYWEESEDAGETADTEDGLHPDHLLPQ